MEKFAFEMIAFEGFRDELEKLGFSEADQKSALQYYRANHFGHMMEDAISFPGTASAAINKALKGGVAKTGPLNHAALQAAAPKVTPGLTAGKAGRSSIMQRMLGSAKTPAKSVGTNLF
jgi:hypothetical protein